MKKSELLKKFGKTNSEKLLRKVEAGNMSKKEAAAAATILEKRFPTPKSTKLVNLKSVKKLTA